MAKTKTGARKKRRPYLQLSRRGTYGSLLLILAACAWVFFVGVLVGRGTAPIHFDLEALQRELRALKQSSEERRRQQLESYATAIEDQPTLDVYAELKRDDDKLTIDPALNRRIPTPTDPAPAAAQAASPDATGVAVIRRLPGLQAKQNRPAESTVRPPTGGETKRAPAADGRLTVQVAALKEIDVARRMVSRLRRQGFDAYQSQAVLPGQGTWYRVRIGRFADRRSAAATVRRLKGQGITPIIVAY
jgi:cell division septation protein DedD